jgi:GTP-binding protein HflX
MKEQRPKALLVGVQTPDVPDERHASDLAELGRLVKTLGYDVVGTVVQRRDAPSASAVLGEGKLRELADLTGGTGLVSSVPKRKSKLGERREREAREAARADDERGDEAEGGEALLGASDHDEPGDDDEQERDERLGEGERDPKLPSLVVVDDEITPSQARNLERATGCRVLDRPSVIIEIFHRHARSKQAKLEVELARLRYVTPRLRESPGGKAERQAGRGAGESALELDRRRVRDRMAELREAIDAIQREQATRRVARRESRRVALVGYTNAGKSSLMRALTGSEVLVEDKLFATLDTTVRALHPAAKPRVLVSDTVGFIQKLPHDLVASFRSTLDEALEASLLLYVVDASDPSRERQLEVTRETLREIGADQVPSLLVANKVDRLDEGARRALGLAHPDALQLSALDPGDVVRLRQAILEFFDRDAKEVELTVPWSKQRIVSEIHESARVVSERWGEDGAHLVVRADEETLARLEKHLAE